MLVIKDIERALNGWREGKTKYAKIPNKMPR